MQRILACAAWFALLGCAPVPAEPAVPPPHEFRPTVLPAHDPVGTGQTPVTTSPVLAVAAQSFEGGGVSVHGDGWLVAGGRSVHLTLRAELGAAFADQLSLRVVRIDARHEGVLLVLPTPDSEDPPTRFLLFVAGGVGPDELIEVLDIVPGAYGDSELWFPGDGTARYFEDGWAACTRAGHPALPVARESVWLSADRTGRFTEFKRQRTDAVQDCGQLAG